MPTPAHHKNLIVAWANGFRIQVRTLSGHDWLLIPPAGAGASPSWAANRQYRIHPMDVTAYTQWLEQQNPPPPPAGEGTAPLTQGWLARATLDRWVFAPQTQQPHGGGYTWTPAVLAG